MRAAFVDEGERNRAVVNGSDLLAAVDAGFGGRRVLAPPNLTTRAPGQRGVARTNAKHPHARLSLPARTNDDSSCPAHETRNPRQGRTHRLTKPPVQKPGPG